MGQPWILWNHINIVGSGWTPLSSTLISINDTTVLLSSGLQGHHLQNCIKHCSPKTGRSLRHWFSTLTAVISITDGLAFPSNPAAPSLASLVYKTILSKTPRYPHLFFSVHYNDCTRWKDYIETTATFNHNSFYFAAADDWNNLHNTPKLTTLTSLTNFKRQLLLLTILGSILANLSNLQKYFFNTYFNILYTNIFILIFVFYT